MGDAPPVSARAQLLTYRFGPGANFEGQLVGALERLESGGALRVVEALFVMSEADGGGLRATGLRGRGAGGIVAPLLSFRLDPAGRGRSTEQALAGKTTTLPAEAIEAVAQTLEPGAAFAVVLVEHVWEGVLDSAVARTGGTPLANELVEAEGLAELVSRVLAAANA